LRIWDFWGVTREVWKAREVAPAIKEVEVDNLTKIERGNLIEGLTGDLATFAIMAITPKEIVGLMTTLMAIMKISHLNSLRKDFYGQRKATIIYHEIYC
jgi:hypothetical protein